MPKIARFGTRVALRGIAKVSGVSLGRLTAIGPYGLQTPIRGPAAGARRAKAEIDDVSVPTRRAAACAATDSGLSQVAYQLTYEDPHFQILPRATQPFSATLAVWRNY